MSHPKKFSIFSEYLPSSNKSCASIPDVELSDNSPILEECCSRKGKSFRISKHANQLVYKHTKNMIMTSRSSDLIKEYITVKPRTGPP